MFNARETSRSTKTPAGDAFLATTDAKPPKQWSKMLSQQGSHARTWTGLPGMGKEAQTSAW
jgi:hypothetical protein